MSEDKLESLRQALERAQQNPPDIGEKNRRITVPSAIRPSRDSRGQRRQVMAGMGKARQAQIERAKRDMIAGARNELVLKAKEQLKP